MLAALFEGVDPDVLLARTLVRFRCISWDVLSKRSDIIVGGGTLDGQQADTELYEQSKVCRVGACDAFLSHSWHDDSRSKWDALLAWCEAFDNTNRRVPQLWLDKVCIDQRNIKADLECLPIYLAACTILLVISGETYTSRLWCCVELFVSVAMDMKDDAQLPPEIIIIAKDDDDRTCVHASWLTFDVLVCKCFDAADKDRILDVIARYPGGILGFNDCVGRIAQALVGSRPEAPRSASSAGAASLTSAPSASSDAASNETLPERRNSCTSEWGPLLDALRSPLPEVIGCVCVVPNSSQRRFLIYSQ
jgi:hypothetical protein